MARDAYSRWNYIPASLTFFDLTADEWAQFHDAISKIAKERHRIESVTGSARGDFLLLNAEGTRPPIFWCFNNWAEPVLLARKLGSDQPVVAMHSLNGVTETRRTKTRFHEHLAVRYLNGMKALDATCPPVIGGNCQGAPVAESIALHAAEAFGIEPLLITLEYVPRRQYRGPMLMLFGAKSRFNPFTTDIDPVAIWRSTLGGFAWGFIDADHGQYFREPGIDQLQRLIQESVKAFRLSGGLPTAEFICSERTTDRPASPS
ncbi:hypothetical protein ThidrDRAFT_4273 [Thiorhodococcus drewsii AZ1]|uniref:Uncharacterized protein n=1 Tax=Thiorhodococcus drewsii AZ1 TaxID=765913 RepID=G2E7L0_9GAMM|nr:hypothetical protein [Thiorhodococcus drewsii]EGV27894.1 hypothetical protein ThidrDRAFT_4273 [Thiorhodococcus drewsii AZ1]